VQGVVVDLRARVETPVRAARREPSVPGGAQGFRRRVLCQALSTAHLVCSIAVQVRLEPVGCEECDAARLAFAIFLSARKAAVAVAFEKFHSRRSHLCKHAPLVAF